LKSNDNNENKSLRYEDSEFKRNQRSFYNKAGRNNSFQKYFGLLSILLAATIC